MSHFVHLTDEEWEAWWESREPDTRVHDELCPRSTCDPREPDGDYGVTCLCWLIDSVMERETKKTTGLSGYRILTEELYNELTSRPAVPF